MEASKEIEISKELDLDIKLEEGGKAVIELGYEGKLGGAKFVAYTSLEKLVDKVTDLIPGEWDDNLIDPLVKKLMAKKSNE